MSDSQPPTPRGSRDQNPPGIGLFALLREDFRTYDRRLLEPGLWTIWIHRFGNWRMGLPRVVRWPLTILYRVGHRLMVLAFGIDMGYPIKLGRRVRIWHHGGIFIDAESIGDDVHLRQNIAMGITRRDVAEGLPVIGDRVDIYAGACIVGPVKVGDDAVIGANSVVTADVAPGATMIGNPARRLPGTGAPQPEAGPRPGAPAQKR